ncbi:MAG: isochorismatase family protein [Saccharofermentanales bacterium]|jgi:nicotinamidase-related amidase
MERFHIDRAAILMIDMQTRLVPALTDPAALVRYHQILLELAHDDRLPVFVTEQHPKGLGPTVPELASRLPDTAAVVEKTRFTAMVPEIADALRRSGRQQIVVTGAETHICVYQTVMDLLAAGYVPFVPIDAVQSRTVQNRDNALALLRQAGAVITNTETLVFEALGDAKTEHFKKYSKLVR